MVGLGRGGLCFSEAVEEDWKKEMLVIVIVMVMVVIMIIVMMVIMIIVTMVIAVS